MKKRMGCSFWRSSPLQRLLRGTNSSTCLLPVQKCNHCRSDGLYEETNRVMKVTGRVKGAPYRMECLQSTTLWEKSSDMRRHSNATTMTTMASWVQPVEPRAFTISPPPPSFRPVGLQKGRAPQFSAWRPGESSWDLTLHGRAPSNFPRE